ncbi:MAG: hypothetical protein QG610_317 [Euryarchaeota archaeon]|nr:hypothetical protein [Euryarchaeota archaeon]
MNKTEKQKEWSAKISKFRKSGEEKAEWCKKNNISIHQFNYWLKQECKSDNTTHILQAENPPPENNKTKWLPVEIKQEEIFSDTPIVIKIGIATAEVHTGFDKEHLSAVLKAL